MFSRRTSWDRQPNDLSAALAEVRGRGETVLDLTATNPTRADLQAPPEVWAALRRAEASVYRPHPFGLPPARAAVARAWADSGVGVEAARVVLTASTSEAHAFLFKLLADPGDEVLVPRPSYPLFDYLAGLEGVTARTYPLLAGPDGWRLDADRLAAAIGPRTRAIVVVQPNHPTGSVVSAPERQILESLARECGLALIADEVFRDHVLDGPPARSLAADAEVLTFALGGLSKTMGLPQLKAAWMAVAGPPAPVAEAMARLEVIADTYLSVGTPVQAALPELLAHRAAAQASIHRRLRANLAALRAAVDSTPARVLPCAGGWCAVVAGPFDGEAVALDLLREDGVLVHPGAFYDFAPGGYLVVSLLAADLPAGAPRLARRLEDRPAPGRT